MRLLVNGNPNYFQILFISCNLIITVVDVLLKFWKNMYSLFHSLSKCPFMFKKVWRNYFFILALTKMRLILESENMNRGWINASFSSNLKASHGLVHWTNEADCHTEWSRPQSSDIPTGTIVYLKYCIFFYCLVSMLLIWSIVSLYDLLPEAGVVMRWYSRESGTYPIHSEMSRVFYLPQHRTLTTRYPLASHHKRSTSYWVSVRQSFRVWICV